MRTILISIFFHYNIVKANIFGYGSVLAHFIIENKPFFDSLLVLFGILNLSLSMFFLIKKNRKNEKNTSNTTNSNDNTMHIVR